MFELISEKDILPKSLFVTGIRIEGDVASSAIGVGGLRRVLKGQYLGHHVALKVLQTAHKTVSATPLSHASPDITDLFSKSSLRKDFCREALVWRSLAHPHILPLLGVFEENSRLFLVSPYMPNGTLTQWRKNQSSPLALEIHRLVNFHVYHNGPIKSLIRIRCLRLPRAFNIFIRKELCTEA